MTLSEYSAFVKAHVNSMPGATPQERMKNVAKAWREKGHVTAAKPSAVKYKSINKRKSMAGGGIHKTMVGGGFFSEFWDGVKAVAKVVKNVTAYTSHLPGVVGTVSSVVNRGLNLVGAGVKPPMTAAQIKKVAMTLHGGRIFASPAEARAEGEKLAREFYGVA